MFDRLDLLAQRLLTLPLSGVQLVCLAIGERLAAVGRASRQALLDNSLVDRALASAWGRDILRAEAYDQGLVALLHSRLPLDSTGQLVARSGSTIEHHVLQTMIELLTVSHEIESARNLAVSLYDRLNSLLVNFHAQATHSEVDVLACYTDTSRNGAVAIEARAEDDELFDAATDGIDTVAFRRRARVAGEQIGRFVVEWEADIAARSGKDHPRGHDE